VSSEGPSPRFTASSGAPIRRAGEGTSGVLGVIRRLRLLDRLLGCTPVELAASVRRLSRHVTPARRFALRELTRSKKTGVYRLRGSDVRIALRHGTPDVWTFNELFELGLYEQPAPVLDVLAGRPRPLRVVDLGANIGLYGALVRTREGDAGIVSFEPDPANLKLLRACIEMNAELGDWQLVAACAAARDGVVRFSALGDPGSRVTDDPCAPSVVEAEARDVFPFLDGVDLLKIDIEGSEWGLLADERFGAAPVVALEYHPHGCPGDDPHAEVDALLARAGYAFEPVYRAPDGSGMRWAWKQGP
jgi:FkbM family methyltransferase